MTYQILTCPNCGGVGCPTCQNTGKVRVDERELTKLKQMLGQMPQTATAPHEALREVGPKPSTTNLAAIIAFSFLSILAGGAAASWYFLRNLKPFFAGLITLFTLIGANFAWKNQFFKLSEPDDFLSAIKKIK